jgi:predicted DNA-binding protein
MSDVPSQMTPAATPAPAQQQAAPATQDGAKTPEPKNEFADTVTKAFNASQMSIRMVKDMQESLAKLTEQLSTKQAEIKKPAGVEEQLAALQRRVDEADANAARDRLNSELVKAASANKVASDRMDYLEFKLRKEHGDKLTDKGIPDPTAPGAMISSGTLVAGLLAKPEGAVFKSAPQTAALPAAASSAPTVAADGVPEFTVEQFEKGLIPPALRKAGAYRIKERTQ